MTSEFLLIRLSEKVDNKEFINKIKKDIGDNISAIAFYESMNELKEEMKDLVEGRDCFWDNK